MAMEGLNQMLNIAKANGWVKGFKVSNRRNCILEISHLLYADDSIIFMGTQPEEMLHLRLILTTFEAVAGLHVNWGKSKLFQVNEVPNIQNLANILECGIENLPTKILRPSFGLQKQVARNMARGD